MAPEPNQGPLINSNPQLQSPYRSLESRIGYRLLLGGTRHLGFYEKRHMVAVSDQQSFARHGRQAGNIVEPPTGRLRP